MGRGLQTHDNDISHSVDGMKNEDATTNYVNMEQQQHAKPVYHSQESEDKMVSSYWSVFADRKTVVLCLTGFFFQ